MGSIGIVYVILREITQGCTSWNLQLSDPLIGGMRSTKCHLQGGPKIGTIVCTP